MKDSKDLHTTFCHKCGLWMEFPYEEDNKLYHQWCLPQYQEEYKPIKIIETEMGNGMSIQHI